MMPNAVQAYTEWSPYFAVRNSRRLDPDWIATEWMKLNESDPRVYLDFALNIGHLDTAEILIEAGKASDDGTVTELLYSGAPHADSTFQLSNDWWVTVPLPGANRFRVSVLGRGDVTGSSLSVIGSIPAEGPS